MGWVLVLQIVLLGSTGLPVGAVIQAQTCNASSVCTGVDTALTASDQLTAGYVSSACSGAGLSILWNVTIQDIDKSVQLCAVPQDTSTICYGQGPPDATAQGWYGDATCAVFKVSAATFQWVDYFPGFSFDAYVGCTFSFRVGLLQSTQGYSALFEATQMPEKASARQTCSSSGCTGIGGVVSIQGIIEWSPPRGTEGRQFSFCYRGGDGLVSVTPERCFNVSVGKCRYCVQGNLALPTVRNDFGLDLDWLRLWTLNGDTIASLGLTTACSPVLNCAGDDKTSMPLMYGPELTLRSSSNKTVVWVGALLRPSQPESLMALAARFRTTIKGILAVNPDQEDSVVSSGTDLCIVPCTSWM